MIVYAVGGRIKVTEATNALGKKLEKGAEGIIVALHTGRVEAAFEGLGLVSVDHGLIKKKVRKTERLIKAKNLKLSDEIYLPGTGEYNKIASVYRNNYDSDDTTVSVETVAYDSKDFTYNEMVQVRR